MDVRTGQSAVDLKIANRCLVLRTIAENPLISRGALAGATRLSKMSVSNIISEFAQQDLVRESENEQPCSGAPGRKASLLDLSPTSPCLMGVLVTRWNVEVVLGDLRANILRLEQREYTPEMTVEILIRMILDAIDAVQHGFDRRILGIGIAAIGPVSKSRGTILAPSNFFGIRDVPIVEVVHKHTGLPVFFSSDSAAAALAEKLMGDGRGHANFLFVLIHEGIGCGVIVNDRPYMGDHGLGGELGHTVIDIDGPLCPCGRRGCLELYASTGRMLRHIRAHLPPDVPMALKSWEDIWNAAVDGIPEAVSAAEEYADALACALSNMVNVFDPELIYLYQHTYREADELMMRLLSERINKSALAQDCRHVAVRPASFGKQAALTGTLALVLSEIFDGKLSFYSKETKE